MKLLIASDIHGSSHYCKLLLDAFEKEKADRLLLLGDILYHGPRNDLPEGYSPKQVLTMLNEINDKILCVRGNCDAAVDQMVLSFPVMADYAAVFAGTAVIYATHGHIYNIDCPPPLCNGDILLYGHTHIPICTEKNGCLYMNPGSVSIPKENSPHSYMTFDGKEFLWKIIESSDIYKSFTIR